MYKRDATEFILNTAFQKANETNAGRIADLYLVLGELSDHTPESVLSAFKELSKGTVAEGAELHFRLVQAEVQCMTCFTKYHPQNGEIVCPVCKSVGAKIISGEEFFLESLKTE
ncbi:MAG TPA: hydrogenase maturation nickel metallochaperone HypA [Anaerolineales bacterium]|jgi:hydrogenase nickel incorporation protein HypA/HybF|nr:hydrogenase maturation nickel metallochaperone HypA [Anaerolineales bacterium]